MVSWCCPWTEGAKTLKFGASRPPCCPLRGARAGGSRLLRGGSGEGEGEGEGGLERRQRQPGELAPASEPEPARGGGRRAPCALGRAQEMAGTRERSG